MAKGGELADILGEVADGLLEKARRAEPTVTRDMEEFASRHGTRLEGLSFRLKGKGSMVRKMSTRLEERPGMRPSEAGKLVKDSLRYTMTASLEDYARVVNDTLRELKERGYEFDDSEVRNYWPRSRLYKGININMRRGDVVMELQFHTPESYDMKQNRTHPLYEEFRRSDTPPERAAELERRMSEILASLEVPPGVEGIGHAIEG